MTVKRTLSLLLVLCMTAALVTGCTPNSGDPATGTQSSTATSTATGTDGAKREVYELVVYGGNDYTLLKQETWETPIGQYILENFDVKITQLPDNTVDWNEQPVLWLASKEYPDIVYCSKTDILKQYIEAGAAVCLDDYQDQLPSFYQNRSDNLDVWRSYSPDGKLHSWTNGDPLSPEGRPRTEGIIIRGDILEEQGYPDVSTTSKLLEVLKKAVKDHPDMLGFSFPGAYGPTWPYLFHAFGDTYRGEGADYGISYNWKSGIYDTFFNAENGAVKESAKFFNDLYKAGLFDEESFTFKDDVEYEKMIAGDVICTMVSTWNTTSANNYFTSEGLDQSYCDFMCQLDSQAKAGQGYCQFISLVNGSHMVLTDKADLSYMLPLLDWFSTDEAQLWYGRGQKGIDWDYDASNKVIALDPLQKFLSGENPSWPYENGLLESFCLWFLGAKYNTYEGDGYPYRITSSAAISYSLDVLPENQAKVYKAYELENGRSSFLDKMTLYTNDGRTNYTVETGSNIADIETNLNELVVTYGAKLTFADDFEAVWAEFEAAMTEAGLQTYVDFCNQEIAG